MKLIKNNFYRGVLFVSFFFIHSILGHAECRKENYTIQKGDSISELLNSRKERLHLSQPIYGKNGILQKFLALNQDRVRDPNQIYPGTVVLMPDELVLANAPKGACSARKMRRVASESPQVESMADPLKQETPLATSKILSSFSGLPFRLDLGLGLILSDGLATTPSIPQFYLSTRIPLSASFDLLSSLSGFFPSYTSASPAFGATEAQARIAAAYRFDDNHWRVGLGARYFTFGYTNPSNAQASSTDGIVLIGYRFDFSDRFEVQTLVDARVSFSLSGSSSDAWVSSPQFSGFGTLVQASYLLGPHLYLGPYLSMDYVNLSWSQATGSNSFNATEIGAGLNLGIGF